MPVPKRACKPPEGSVASVMARSVSRLDGAMLQRLWEQACRGEFEDVVAHLDKQRVTEEVETTKQWSETHTIPVYSVTYSSSQDVKVCDTVVT